MNTDTAAEIRERGFAIVERVFESFELEAILKELTSGSLPRSRAGLRHAMQRASVTQLSVDPRLMALARGVLGEAAQPFRATFFDKSLVSNWLVVWHQDTALPLRIWRDAPDWGPWSVKAGVHYAHAPARALERAAHSF